MISLMKQALHGKRVSRADVARAAGVAPCTVSLVLNKTPGARVSEKVRQKIQDAAETLGYRPSAAARALVTGKTRTIAVVLFQGGNPFDEYTNGILGPFWKKVNHEKYRMVIDSISMDGNAADFFIDNTADGIVLMAPPREVNNLSIMQTAKFPLICIGNTPDCGNVDYVDLDNYASGKEATQHLIENGHRKIAHIAGVLEHSSTAVERLNGYRDALTEAGIRYNPELVIHAPFEYHYSKNAARNLLGRGVDFTAVFTACIDGAYALIDVATEQGIRVPEDLSVVSIKARNYGRRCGVSGILNPLDGIGISAAEILLSRLNGRRSMPEVKKLHGELFVGSTVKKL